MHKNRSIVIFVLGVERIVVAVVCVSKNIPLQVRLALDMLVTDNMYSSSIKIINYISLTGISKASLT
jgi:hypothetical protein